jgi:hypothetical protein
MLGLLADSTVVDDCSKGSNAATHRGTRICVCAAGCGIAACAMWHIWHVQ